MKVFVYKIRKKNTIKISEIPRETTDDVLKLELLFRLDVISLVQVLKDLRPYQCLWALPDIQFKMCQDVINYFEQEGFNLPQDISIEHVEKNQIEKTINDFLDSLNLLAQNKVVSINKRLVEKNKKTYTDSYKNIEFSCDIYNYLSDIYGINTIDTILEFNSLSNQKKDIIRQVENIYTQGKKEDYLNTQLKNLHDEEDILRFLPEWYRIKHKINKLLPRDSKVKTECEDLEKIRPSEEQIKEENFEKLKSSVYKIFSLGEIYEGTEIIDKLREIFINLGIIKTAKIKDLEVFFEYTKVNLNNISKYKLVTRKFKNQ